MTDYFEINRDIQGEALIEIFGEDGELEYSHTNKNKLTDYGIRYLLTKQLDKTYEEDLTNPFESVMLAYTDRSTDRGMLIPKGIPQGTATFKTDAAFVHSKQGNGVKLHNTLQDGKYQLVAEWDSTKEIGEFNTVYLYNGTREVLNDTGLNFGNGYKSYPKSMTLPGISSSFTIASYDVLSKDDETIIIWDRKNKNVCQYKIRHQPYSNGYYYEMVRNTSHTLDITTNSYYTSTNGYVYSRCTQVFLYSKTLDKYLWINSEKEKVEEYNEKGEIKRTYYILPSYTDCYIFDPYSGKKVGYVAIPMDIFPVIVEDPEKPENDVSMARIMDWGMVSNAPCACHKDGLLFSYIANGIQCYKYFNLVTEQYEFDINTGYPRTMPGGIVEMRDNYYMIDTTSNPKCASIFRFEKDKSEYFGDIFLDDYSGQETLRQGVRFYTYVYPFGPDCFFRWSKGSIATAINSLGFSPATINVLLDNTNQPIKLTKPTGKSMKITYTFTFAGIENNKAKDRITSRALQSMLFNALGHSNNRPLRPLGTARVIGTDGYCLGFAEALSEETFAGYESMQGTGAPTAYGYHLDLNGDRVVDIGWNFGYGKANGSADNLTISGAHWLPGGNNNQDGSSYGVQPTSKVTLTNISNYLVAYGNNEYYMVNSGTIYRIRYYFNGLIQQSFARDDSFKPIELEVVKNNNDTIRQMAYFNHLNRWVLFGDSKWYYYTTKWEFVNSIEPLFTDEDNSKAAIRYVSDGLGNLYGFRTDGGALKYFNYDIVHEEFVFDRAIDISQYGAGSIRAYFPGDEYFHLLVYNPKLTYTNSGKGFIYSFKVDDDKDNFSYKGHTETAFSSISSNTLLNMIPTGKVPMKFCYIDTKNANLLHSFSYYSYKQSFNGEYNKTSVQSYTQIFRARLK